MADEPVVTNPFDEEFNKSVRGRVNANGEPFAPDQWTSGSARQAAQTTTQTTTKGQSDTQGEQRVYDALGLGDLVKGNVTRAQGIDDTRNSNIQSIASGNDPRYQSVVNSAVRNAVSNPGTNAAGDNAQLREAIIAGNNASGQSVSAQLAANQQLGNTETAKAIQLGNPYLGQDTNNQTNSLVDEMANGLARSYNERFAIGKGPENKTEQSSGSGGGGGMSWVCTQLNADGMLTHRQFCAGALAQKYQPERMYNGYTVFAKWYIRTFWRFSIAKYVAKSWVKYISNRYANDSEGSALGKVTHFVLYPVCLILSFIKGRK
jgi:hypothetical protein